MERKTPSLQTSSETCAAQAGGAVHGDERAIVSPIHITTTYERAPDNSYPGGKAYGRPDNATVEQCQTVINTLERAAATLMFGSGMAAATSFFLSLERPARVVVPKVMYWALRNWLGTDAPSFGVHPVFVDATQTREIEAAVRQGETRAIWIETPANPLWSLTDIAETAAIARRAGALLGVDSTAATPVHTQPLALGADVVMHSATKYLNGHSDALAGSLSFARQDAAFERASRLRGELGSVLGPFEAALLLRGMRTLFVRVERQSASAQRIAERFAGDARLADVLYPGLEGHTGHATACKQMANGFGGMLSLRLAGGENHAIQTAARLKVFKRATSLGGVESLVEHRASIEGPGTPCPTDLLRFSIGLEAVDDLIADIDQALR